MPAHIINEGIVSGGMFIAIGESIIARVAALGGYISFSLTGRPKTPYEQVSAWHCFGGCVAAACHATTLALSLRY